jgi:glutamine synthetase
VPESCREIPFEKGMLLFIGEFEQQAAAVCPRNLLHRVIKKAEDMGFDAFAALEYEFFMFKETPESAREKGYKNLETLSPDMFGYSVLRSSVHSDLYEQILDMSEKMDFPIEGIHTETGPGVLEAAIAVDNAANAADKGALFSVMV